MVAPISNLNAEVKALNNYSNKVKWDAGIVKNVNWSLVEQLLQTEQQYWENALYSKSLSLEVVGIPTLVKDVNLKEKYAVLN